MDSLIALAARALAEHALRIAGMFIDRRERGLGIAKKLFTRLKAELPGREGILFIRRDNAASLRVHQDKLGMVPREDYDVNGAGYTVLSHRAEAAPVPLPLRLGSEPLDQKKEHSG